MIPSIQPPIFILNFCHPDSSAGTSTVSVTIFSVGVTCLKEEQATATKEKRTSIKFFIG